MKLGTGPVSDVMYAHSIDGGTVCSIRPRTSYFRLDLGAKARESEAERARNFRSKSEPYFLMSE